MSELEVTTAYDLTPMGSVPQHDREQVFSMLNTAQGLYLDRTKWLDKPTIMEVFEKFISLVEQKKQDLILAAAKEGGKPYVDSKVEVERGIQGVKVALSEIEHMAGEMIPMGHTASSAQRLAFTVHEPRGVVLGVSAFNHPFNLIIHQVIPALAVGCPVLIKPAANTPISCKSVVDMLHEAGLPQGWCQFLMCENDVTSELISDSRVQFLTFIGSSKVGWMLRSKLAPGAQCVLEHGGVAPVILHESANLDEAIEPLAKGAYYHAGQVCVSVQRIYVAESISEEFCSRFVERVKTLKVGDPTDPKTEVGPLIRPGEVDRVESWVQEAVSAGAKVLCGGERISKTCYQPTVLLNPPNDAKVSQQEIFGPVSCIYPYQDRDEAIRLANAPNVAFQASVFSKDIDVALDTAKKLKGMAVMINDHTAFRVDWMPFGGYQESGLGVGGIGHSMKDMSVEKLVVVKSKSL